ncbi:hypothetical protein [Methylobacterium gnaphalii]|uniref:hypothetical protein n=1 Tax=Methylobacterium gnaphalii TaxID=1010610 RepID=UPI0011BD7EF5|nr:hypothetical protein [Methylobacterium gnaphalii]GJD71538.1 hypothetical protein MMMDOFMJ_4500 [Methylobacterium gnaphalii]
MNLVKSSVLSDLLSAERGGPVPAVPNGRGFGSGLIQRTVEGQFHGSIVHRWEPHGLDILISLPADML